MENLGKNVPSQKPGSLLFYYRSGRCLFSELSPKDARVLRYFSAGTLFLKWALGTVLKLACTGRKKEMRAALVGFFDLCRGNPEILSLDERYFSEPVIPKIFSRIVSFAEYFVFDTAAWIIVCVLSPWRFTRRMKFSEGNSAVREILIIYMGEGLGDVIIFSGTLPALRRKFPEAKIRLFAFERYREFFDGNPNIDEMIGYPDYRFAKGGLMQFLRFSREVRKKCRPDILLTLLPDKRACSAFFSALVPSRFSVGFDHLWKKICFDAFAKVDWNIHLNQGIFEALKLVGIEKPPFEYWIPPADAQSNILEGIPDIPGTVILAPGGKNNLIDRGNESHWDFGNYFEIVKALEREGRRVILVGAEYDRNPVWDGFDGEKVVNLIGKTNLRQLFDLVKNRADVVVCNNSGLLHVAAALGVPTVSYAGPLISIKRFGPFPNDGRHKVLQPRMCEAIREEVFLASIREKLDRPDKAWGRAERAREAHKRSEGTRAEVSEPSFVSCYRDAQNFFAGIFRDLPRSRICLDKAAMLCRWLFATGRRFFLSGRAKDFRAAVLGMSDYIRGIREEKLLNERYFTESLTRKFFMKIFMPARYFLMDGLFWLLRLCLHPWYLLRRCRFDPHKGPVKEIMIVYMGEGLGDVIMLSGALPAVRRKFPRSRIRLLVFDRFRDYFEGNSHIDEILGYPDYRFEKEGLLKFLMFSRTIRKVCRFDIVMDLLPDKRFGSGLFCFLVPSRFSVGFGYLWKKLWFDRTSRIRWDSHVYEVIFDALKFLGIEREPPDYWVPPARGTNAILEGIPDRERTVVLAPGGKNNLVDIVNESRWDFGGYYEIVKQLAVEGTRVILVGAEYDRNPVWDEFGRTQVVNLIGKTDLRQLFELVRSRAAVVVCNNSGLLHVAVAIGVPTVSYAGPLENIKRFGPYPNDGRHVVLQPRAHQTISKEEFLSSIRERLSQYAAAEK